jgi:hypothetical protein
MANNFAIINVNKNNKKNLSPPWGYESLAYQVGKQKTGFYTDKKENQIFLIHEEIQNGAVAMSYLTNDLLIYGEIFAHFLIY